MQMLHIPLHPVPTLSQAVEQISMAMRDKKYLHVVSLNPENIMTAQTDVRFAAILSGDSMQIIDGTGVLLASRWTGEYQKGWQRVTGVDLMPATIESLAKIQSTTSSDTAVIPAKAGISRPTVCLLGGRNGVAAELCEMYTKRYPSLHFVSLPNYDADDPNLEKKLSVIFPNSNSQTDHFSSPSLLFVAFGSPTQELWIDMHKDLFPHTVCMGVGGAFDMLSGRASRAPHLLRSLGLEWLYRLITQPWRWRRQISLIKFLYKIA